MKKTILIICFSELHKDPRVLREVESLRDNYRIVTGGFTPTGIEDLFIKLSRPPAANKHWKYPFIFRKVVSAYLRIRIKFISLLGNLQYEITYWDKRSKDSVKRLCASEAHLVLANDLNILPIADRVSRKLNAPLIFDAHEYYPLEFENNISWRKEMKPFYEYLCRKYLPKANDVTVVSETIGNKYREEFGLNKFYVVDNAANFFDLQPTSVNADKIKLVHHGFAIPERKIENLIKILDNLDTRFELHLILVYNNQTEYYYRQLVNENAGNKRVFFHDPVPFNKIPEFINQFDIGIYFMDTANFNNYSTIPNKFYEFIQARLMIAICPSIELEQIIDKYQLGIYTKTYDYREMADRLNALDSREISLYKSNSHKYARELSSEKNKRTIRKVVDKLLNENA